MTQFDDRGGGDTLAYGQTAGGDEATLLVDGTGKLQVIAIVSGVVTVQEPLDTEEQETAPTDASKNNPSFALTYTGDNLTGVAMTIDGSTYNKTLGYTGDNLTSVGAWVAA